MECSDDDSLWIFSPRKTFRVIIVGAGIAGLTAACGLKRAGHDVVILERARRLDEVGAGVQLAPNATRILRRLGLLQKIMNCANIMEYNSSRRWQTNEEIGRSPLMPEASQRFNAPLVSCHRADLQRILLEAVYAAKVEVLLDQKVVAIDSNFSARAQVASGQWFTGDVLLAADGIKSFIQGQMASAYGSKDRRRPTGDAAYRVVIPRERLLNDQAALEMLKSNISIRWLGPKAHIVAYPLKNNQLYNMVLIHPEKPDTENVESWTRKGDKLEMLNQYRDWNEVTCNLLSYVPAGNVIEWTLNQHLPLPHWVKNQCALMGDTCHAMLPYVAQGAAQAIEDAGVLTVALSLADEVPTALRVYEKVRKARAEAIQNSASKTRTTLHLPDGPEQERRDMAMGRQGPNPDMWADGRWQEFMWGEDNMKETLTNWDKLVVEVEKDVF